MEFSVKLADLELSDSAVFARVLYRRGDGVERMRELLQDPTALQYLARNFSFVYLRRSKGVQGDGEVGCVQGKLLRASANSLSASFFKHCLLTRLSQIDHVTDSLVWHKTQERKQRKRNATVKSPEWEGCRKRAQVDATVYREITKKRE